MSPFLQCVLMRLTLRPCKLVDATSRCTSEANMNMKLRAYMATHLYEQKFIKLKKFIQIFYSTKLVEKNKNLFYLREKIRLRNCSNKILFKTSFKQFAL